MFVKVITEEQIEIVESLAKEIWSEHYTAIIGKHQVDYMLGKFQSKQAITEQISNGYSYFLIEDDKNYVGYLAALPQKHELFLSKLYLKSSKRGKGLGKKAIHFLEEFALKEKLQKITLTVNKNNINSIKAYEKLGFKNSGAIIQDIGCGYVMDDFRMEKDVPSKI
jgi:RimJ/RimL family protein N-acetyltransferase